MPFEFQQIWLLLIAHGKNLAWSVGLCAFLGIIEWLRPGGRRSTFIARVTNFRFALLITVALITLAAPMNQLVSLLDERGLLGGVLPAWKRSDDWVSWLLVLLTYGFVWDFFQYWTHRLEHISGWLWKFHRVHHSDPDVNASTSQRHSLGSLFLHFFLMSIPTAVICGFNILDGLAATILFAGWGFFNHANIRLNLGVLTPIISGPQLHRLHHGVAREYHNCNYAAFFPVLDIMFGTYRAPRCDEYPQTGVQDSLHFAGPEQEFFSPLLQRQHSRTVRPDAADHPQRA